MRRGRCPACKKTFTVLPTWSAPYGHYSYNCRQQAWDASALHATPALLRDAPVHEDALALEEAPEAEEEEPAPVAEKE